MSNLHTPREGGGETNNNETLHSFDELMNLSPVKRIEQDCAGQMKMGAAILGGTLTVDRHYHRPWDVHCLHVCCR